MPLRRRYRPRRRVRRVGRRTKRFVIKRYLRKKAKLGLNAYKLKLPVQSVTSDVAGVINPAFSTRIPSGALELTNFNALYDSYRVCAVKVKFIPYGPNDTTSTRDYQPLFGVHDPDDLSGTNTITSVNQILQYDNFKTFNLYKPWKWYFKVSKIMNGKQANGTDDIITYGRGLIDINTPCYTGNMCFYGIDYTPSTKYGNLIVTYYILYANRR